MCQGHTGCEWQGPLHTRPPGHCAELRALWENGPLPPPHSLPACIASESFTCLESWLCGVGSPHGN